MSVFADFKFSHVRPSFEMLAPATILMQRIERVAGRTGGCFRSSETHPSRGVFSCGRGFQSRTLLLLAGSVACGLEPER